mmetsp:Transcript_27226/g.48926  ORF Transcript_27226/g.48926 Transcript_27226/m.48926 type:complete len:359 (-) Transcript_27226:107-1183(-)
MSSLKKTYGNFFVLLMYALLVACYYVYVVLILWPLSDSPQVCIELILFHVIFVMQQWSLIAVIFSEPGSVPLHWGFHVGDSESKRRRYCLMCHVFKPERCHHCSACNKCVLNMDHHCPWINNCVGFYNRKTFLLTLFYSSLLAICFAIGSLPSAYHAALNLQYDTAWPSLCFIGVFLCSMFFAIIITAFLKFHIRLVRHNLTTIENLDKSEARNNYSAGARQNWVQVFGRNPWIWPFPFYGRTGKPVGDGVHWMYAETEFIESSSRNSEKAETPRLMRNSVINPSITTANKSEILENITSSPQRSRFFAAAASEVDTDTSFLQSRPRSALTIVADAFEEAKKSHETLKDTMPVDVTTE